MDKTLTQQLAELECFKLNQFVSFDTFEVLKRNVLPSKQNPKENP